MSREGAPLPPGWDMKYDARTSRYYYINHYTKTTSWQDPREKYQQIGKPTTNKENQRPAAASTSGAGATNVWGAAAGASSSSGGAGASSSAYGGAGASASYGGGGVSAYGGLFGSGEDDHGARNPVSLSDYRQRSASPGNRAAAAASSAAARAATPQMGASTSYLPSHVTTFGSASPQPLARLQQEELGGAESPASQRSTRRDSHILAEILETNLENTEQDEPDLDALARERYLKSVFPTVEEYLLLDVLANSDNNVQKASDRLVKMGYVKRDAPSAPRLHAKKREEERLAEKRTPLPKPPPIKTDAEKETLRNKMKDKYEKRYEIPERILFMALESVLYDEEQANNLITSMIEDDLKRQKKKEAEKAAKAKERAEKKKSPKPVRKMPTGSVELSPKSPRKTATQPTVSARKSAPKSTPKPRVSQGTSTAEEVDSSTPTTSLAKGPNQALRKGPNDDLLLTDYVVWNGPDASLRRGANKDLVQGKDEGLALGPNPEYRRGPANGALGPNPDNRKGPQSLARGTRIEYTGQPIRSC